MLRGCAEENRFCRSAPKAPESLDILRAESRPPAVCRAPGKHGDDAPLAEAERAPTKSPGPPVCEYLAIESVDVELSSDRPVRRQTGIRDNPDSTQCRN